MAVPQLTSVRSQCNFCSHKLVQPHIYRLTADVAVSIFLLPGSRNPTTVLSRPGLLTSRAPPPIAATAASQQNQLGNALDGAAGPSSRPTSAESKLPGRL